MSARMPKARTTTAIRFEPDVHAALEAAAEDHDRSINWLVNQACKDFLPRLRPASEVRLLRDDTTGERP